MKPRGKLNSFLYKKIYCGLLPFKYGNPFKCGALPWSLSYQTQVCWDQNLSPRPFLIKNYENEQLWEEMLWKSDLGQESTRQRPKKGLWHSHCRAQHQRVPWPVPTYRSVREDVSARLHAWLGERGVHNPKGKRRGPSETEQDPVVLTPRSSACLSACGKTS